MSLKQFNTLKECFDTTPDLREEFELAFAAIASKHHPSDRAERFVFGGMCEWLLAVTSWKAGVRAFPAGHGQNGFDLMQFKGAMQGLWSLKSSASYKSNTTINLRNNISSNEKAVGAVYNHPTVFMGPYLPGITYVDFSVSTELAAAISYDEDAAKLKSKLIQKYAEEHPEFVIRAKLTAEANVSIFDSNLKLVANVLSSGTYPILGRQIEMLQKYSQTITVLRELHASGSISDADFNKTLLEMELK